MKGFSQRSWSVVLAFALLIVSQASAQQHVVPLSELQGKIHSAAQDREKNITDIERVLSYPAAVQALEKAGVKQNQVRVAVATLADDELARLADRARASVQDVQGGIIVGLLALIGLIVVILIVVAVVADARPAPGSTPNGGIEHTAAIPQVAPIYS